MFRVLYSDKLTRGQLLTHPKNHKCIMQTGCKMHVNTHIGQMRHTILLVRDNSENYS